MFKVNVYTNNVFTNSANFKTTTEAQNWLNELLKFKHFKHDRWLLEEEFAGERVEDATETSIRLVDFFNPESQQIEALEKQTYFFPKNYTYEILDVTAQVEQEKINEEALQYLQDTDWYAIRYAETGIEIPEAIRIARQDARGRIVR